MQITGSPKATPNDLQEAEVKNNALSTTSPYQDLGAVVDTTNMAAGATVYSNWVDDVAWVRNILIFVSTDQQFDVVIKNRDTAGTTPNANATNTNQSAQPASYGRYPITGSSAILGYSVAFGVKNSSASPNTFTKARVQLMGL